MSLKTRNSSDARVATGDTLLAWYDHAARSLPWRITPEKSKAGLRGQAYHIWLSEVMLQQTTVATVIEYYQKFLRNWPDIHKLATASEDDILKAWAGLGYYSRARNLHKCARQVSAQLGGKFPNTIKGLKELPGIGDYTANAIAAIAFSQSAIPLDGNIKRVITRLFALPQVPDTIKPLVCEKYREMEPVERPGDFAQAMMDLGATICRPKNPNCDICPLSDNCQALAKGQQTSLPAKALKQPRPKRLGTAYVIISKDDGAIYLQKRPPKGLLASMSEIPSGPWAASESAFSAPAEILPEIIAANPEIHQSREECDSIEHVFTHFQLELRVFKLTVNDKFDSAGWWSGPDQIADEALPTVMKKAIASAVPGLFALKKAGD